MYVCVHGHLLIDDGVQTSQTRLTEGVPAVQLAGQPVAQVVGAVADNAVQLAAVSGGSHVYRLHIALHWSLWHRYVFLRHLSL